jgi:hypothetical protein
MSLKSLPTRARLQIAAVALVASVSVLSIGAAAGSAAGGVAVASRTIALNDSAHLHKISSHGLKLYESGTATGSVGGSLYLHLNVTSTRSVTAEISVYPKGASMTGTGSAKYEVDGGTARFSGTMSIIRGTGSYNHAHGTGLKFSGTIQRSNDAVTVHVSGNLST